MSSYKSCHVTAPHVPVPKVPVTQGQVPHTDDSHDDRMILSARFAEIQKLIPHRFTLDVCADVRGHNSLCPRYCSLKNDFLRRDLRNEFIWMNPPFRSARVFLDHYMTQRMAHPESVGGCILLPAWSSLTSHSCLRAMRKLVHYPKGTRLFSQPVENDPSRRLPMAGIP